MVSSEIYINIVITYLARYTHRRGLLRSARTSSTLYLRPELLLRIVPRLSGPLLACDVDDNMYRGGFRPLKRVIRDCDSRAKDMLD